MANATVLTRRLQQWLQEWWGGLNACESTGAHGVSPRLPGALAIAVICYRDWPPSVRCDQGPGHVRNRSRLDSIRGAVQTGICR